MIDLADVARKVAPTARAEYIEGLSSNVALFDKHAINHTPLRATNFLAQIMGETGGLRIVQESGAYSAPRISEIFGVGNHSAKITPAEAARIGALPVAQRGPVLFDRVYGLGNPKKARELGNTQLGDGWLFRGIGPMQSTGRGAARRWGMKCGVDFEADVMLMVAPKWIMMPPVLEWTAGNLNALADADDVRGIRRIINGGYNGIDDVEAWHDRIWKILRTSAVEPWQAARPLLSMQQLQESLNQIGFTPELVEDGRYGPKTKAAVRWFQGIEGLKVDGIAGPITHAALGARLSAFHVPLLDEAA